MLARVVVQDIRSHDIDSMPEYFERMGAIAVREALLCVAEDREPDLGATTKVWRHSEPPPEEYRVPKPRFTDPSPNS